MKYRLLPYWFPAVSIPKNYRRSPSADRKSPASNPEKLCILNFKSDITLIPLGWLPVVKHFWIRSFFVVYHFYDYQGGDRKGVKLWRLTFFTCDLPVAGGQGKTRIRTDGRITCVSKSYPRFIQSGKTRIWYRISFSCVLKSYPRFTRRTRSLFYTISAFYPIG